MSPLTAAAIVEGYEVRRALELHAAEAAVGNVSAQALVHFRTLLLATSAAVSHAEWDAANAAFHEHQVDLARNALLSRFYRELSVNLMMQVIRGGKLEAGAYLATEHGAIVDASRPASSPPRRRRSEPTSTPAVGSRSTRWSRRAARSRRRWAPTPVSVGS